MQPQIPPPAQVGEITVQDLQRQEFEQDLTRSNWRYFLPIQEHKRESPLPGSGRREDEQT